MDEVKDRLFEDLCSGLNEIEARFFVETPLPPDDEDGKPDLRIVPIEPEIEEDENDQTEDVSGQIAALNDRFRQTQPTEDSDIPGEWIMGEDVTALPVPTKAAIMRRIADYGEFDGFSLRDQGAFDYESKDKTYPVIWMIKVFEDVSKSAEADHPEDAMQSYRVMLVTLSDQLGEEE